LSRCRHEHYDGLGGDGLPRPDRAQPLHRPGLDVDAVDRQVQQFGNPPTHGLFGRTQARLLRQNVHIHVADGPPLPLNRACGVPQKHRAVDVFPPRIVVREMFSDVAQSARAEDRIGDGVQNRIGVAMTGQTNGPIQHHPAEDQLPPRDESVNVEPDSDTDIHALAPKMRRSTGVPPVKVTAKMAVLRPAVIFILYGWAEGP